MPFQQLHLNKLKDCMSTEKIEEWGTPMSPRKFVNAVLRNDRDENLLDLANQVNEKTFSKNTVNRTDVVDFVRCNSTSALEKALFVLAWGGMRTHHAIRALNSYQNGWKTIVEEMLNGSCDRVKAYKQFHSLRIDGELSGMGPAFFTKLIFFLEPNHNGYIMDQWTARSMNLLRSDKNRRIHLLRGGSWITKPSYRRFSVDPQNNDCAVYTAFCKDLECLARLLGKEPEETEKIIFSRGGSLKKLGCWRRYVLENTSKRNS